MNRTGIAARAFACWLLAAATTHAASLKPSDAAQVLVRARRQAAEGETVRAIEALRGLLAAQPRLVEAHLLYIELRRRTDEGAVRRDYERALAAHPSSALHHFLAARLAAGPRARLRLCRKAVELDPRLYHAQLELGCLCRRPEVDDVAAAVRALRAAAALRPKAAVAHLELARALRIAGRTAEARGAAERAVALDPRGEEPWAELADLARAGKLPGAEATLRRAVEACPRSGRLWWMLGRWRCGNRCYDEAREPLEQALRLGPKADYAAEARDLLAACCLRRGGHAKARGLAADAWSDAADEMAAGLLTAQAFRKFHDARAADGERRLALLEHAARLAPRSLVIRRGLAAGCLRQKRFGRAADVLAELAARVPGDAELLGRCARAHLLAARPEAAAGFLRRVPRPRSLDALCLLADAEALAAGRLSREAFLAGDPGVEPPEPPTARRRLRACIERHPSTLTPRLRLAVLLLGEARGHEARQVLEAAAKVQGPPALEAELQSRLGDLASAEKYFAKAVGHYEAAIARRPEVARYHGALARACVAHGDLTRGRAALARQLELDPASYDAAPCAPPGKGPGHRLESRLDPGTVLRYRYTTDGGKPKQKRAGMELRYCVDAVLPGRLVDGTLEVVKPTGRPVKGAEALAGTRLSMVHSEAFGLVHVARPRRRLPPELGSVRTRMQFVLGCVLPAARWPGQRWHAPAWTPLGFETVVCLERVEGGKAYLTKIFREAIPGDEAGSTRHEEATIAGQADVVFDLRRRLVERADITAQWTMPNRGGGKRILPRSHACFELLGVERRAGPAGRQRLLHVPYVKQVGPKCAAAALAMALRHFGRKVDQERLFAQASGGQAGVSLSALNDTARHHGFAVHPCLGSLAGLKGKLDAGLPVLLCIHVHGMGHVVVAVGYNEARGDVVVHDPAVAPFRRIAVASLDGMWRATDQLCLGVAPAGEKRAGGLAYPHQQAVAGLLEGDRAFRKGRVAQAERAYRRALGLRPGLAQARVGLARVRGAQGRTAEALAELDRLLRERPSFLPAQVAKAELLAHAGRCADAIALAQSIERRVPEHLPNLSVLATAYLRSTQLPKAIATLERAVGLARQCTALRLRLAAFYVIAHQYDKAAAQCEAAVGQEPRSAAALYQLASTLQFRLETDRRRHIPWPGRRARARRIIECLEALRTVEGPSSETSADLARLYDDLGNTPRAIQCLQRSVREMTKHQLRQRRAAPPEADPFSVLTTATAALDVLRKGFQALNEAREDRATNLNNLAWAYATRGQNLQEARRIAERSVALHRAGFNLDTLAWTDYRLGKPDDALETLLRAAILQPDPVVEVHLAIAHLKLGHADQARTHFARAARMKRDGGPAEVHLEIADACAQAHLRDRELAALEAAVKADPKHRKALYRLALACLERSVQLPRALDIAETLHAADPHDPLHAGLLGAAAQLANKRRKARPLLEQAVRDDPLLGPSPLAPFHYFLGLSLHQGGDRARAAALLKRYVHLEPHGPFAASAARLLNHHAPSTP